ncbi:proline-rich protein [Pisolithus croceorrhizus]|nr:proline-rich protein [Pisolithus croceorrhizus]
MADLNTLIQTSGICVGVLRRVFVAAAVSVGSSPLGKWIAQVTVQWEQACNTAGGGLQCNPVAVAAFSTLLAGAGPCDQQNAADNMIDLAKTLNDNADMIRLTQIFAQQSRNSPTAQSMPYCQSAPRNEELNGLFQCQWQGDDLQTFAGGIAVGKSGTIPFGMSAPVSPAGSCPANPSGPIPDGIQLVNITQNPTPPLSSETPTSTGEVVSAATTPSLTPASGGDFRFSNGKAAQHLNAQFASLTPSSSCASDTNACVQGSFAKCVSGSFVLQSCGTTLTCAALPLVNSPGTSVTCTTLSEAEARIAATGATGGLTGAS